MADLFGSDYIFNTLKNYSDLTDIIPAAQIYNSRLIPKDETARDTINFYRISPRVGSNDLLSITYSADCRSDSEGTADSAANEVSNAVNRKNITYGGNNYFALADILPVIQPRDEKDTINVPVSIQIRRH